MKSKKITIFPIIIFIIIIIITPVYAITYKYDDLNRLTEVIYDSGKTIHYNYDAAGNMIGVEVTTPTPTLNQTPTNTPTNTPIASPTPTITQIPIPTQLTTQSPDELLQNTSFTLGNSSWGFWTEGIASATCTRDTAEYDSSPASIRIDIANKGTSLNNIQLFTTGIKVEAGKTYKLSFKARCDVGIAIPSINLMSSKTPWKSYSIAVSKNIGQGWNQYEALFKSDVTDNNARITFFLGGKIENGGKFHIDSLSFKDLNLIKNSSSNSSPWSFWTETDALARSVRDEVYSVSPAYEINCTNNGNSLTSIQLFTTGINIVEGKHYKLSFKAKSENGTSTPVIYLMQANSPWNNYAAPAYVTVGTEWTFYERYFTANKTDPNARISFFLGNAVPENGKLCINTVSLIPVDALPEPGAIDSNQIRLWTEGSAIASGTPNFNSIDSIESVYMLDVADKGQSITDIQLYLAGLNIEEGKSYKLKFKARTEGQKAVPVICMMKAASPWTAYTDSVKLTIGSTWDTYEVVFTSKDTDSNGRLTFFLGGKVKNGSKLYLDSITLNEFNLLPNPSFTTNAQDWFLWKEGTAVASGTRDISVFDSTPASYRLDCINNSNDNSSIQFFTTKINIEAGKRYKFRFRAKSKGGISKPMISLTYANSPWTGYAKDKVVKINGDWATYEVTFKPDTTDTNARITFFLGNRIPDGSSLYLDSMSFSEIK